VGSVKDDTGFARFEKSREIYVLTAFVHVSGGHRCANDGPEARPVPYKPVRY
jgi:hypothetical protein